MKYEYSRLSKGVHLLAHDQMEDRPVYQVNVAEDNDMMKAVRLLEIIHDCLEDLYEIDDTLIETAEDLVKMYR